MLNIAENIKRLRQEKGVTQEELATTVGVTFQAVSKWELGHGYPDITFLPALAEYFGVSIDALVREDTKARKRELEKRYKQISDIHIENDEDQDEIIELLRALVRDFPDERNAMVALSMELMRRNRDEQDRREAVTLAERAANLPPPPGAFQDYAYQERVNLCQTYASCGADDKAAELARGLPSARYSREVTYPRFAPLSERVLARQTEIDLLTSLLYGALLQFAREGCESGHHTAEDALRLMDTAEELYRTVYGISPSFANSLYDRAYDVLNKAGFALTSAPERPELALALLEELPAYYDEVAKWMTSHKTPTILDDVLRWELYEKQDAHISTYLTTDPRKYTLNRALKEPLYDAVRDEPRFLAVIDRLS
jgi:transcriptional regulator with XRE-family HTH domain